MHRRSPVRQPMRTYVALLLVVFAADVVHGAGPSDDRLRDEASLALKRAATFFREQVSVHGGYVYYYSLDLKQRWGEGRAGPGAVFVEPPGTPAVGEAYLTAYKATGDEFYLSAARAAGQALVDGQLKSGGWSQVIHFAPAQRMGNYRTRKGGRMNNSSLDDDQSQSALRFLMRLDAASGFADKPVHEAVTFGLESLLAAQFANGGFPQVWTEPADAQPVATADYPDYDWRTEGRVKNYWDYYTLNDGLAGTVADTLILAHQTYGEVRFAAALRRLGDFLIRAQMPDPQPAWCQQYNYQMHPMWARRFEPPAIAGSESQDAMRTLIKIAVYTGDEKYLEPLPRALRYLQQRCLLPESRLARFYELQTNRPLYMDGDYNLTYDPSDAPSHYGWQQASQLDSIAAAYQRARRGTASFHQKPARINEQQVGAVIAALDGEGRWVSTFDGERLTGQPKFEPGFRYLSSAVFADNVRILSAYLAATR